MPMKLSLRFERLSALDHIRQSFFDSRLLSLLESLAEMNLRRKPTGSDLASGPVQLFSASFWGLFSESLLQICDICRR